MKKITSVLFLSAAISSPAFATDEGFYAAIDLGQASYSHSQSAFSTATFPKPKAILIGGGYHFSQFVGMEAGYAIIGDSTVTTVAGANYATEVLKASSFKVAAVGTYAINDMFEVFGKLGLANTKIDWTSTSNVAVASGSLSGSKTDLMFGIGGQYNINKHIGIRAQYEDFGKVTIGTPPTNLGVTVISVGGVYNF